MLGLYGDNGKEHGNYYGSYMVPLGLYWEYTVFYRRMRVWRKKRGADSRAFSFEYQVTCSATSHLARKSPQNFARKKALDLNPLTSANMHGSF